MLMWVGLKPWRSADAHLRLNQAMSIRSGAFEVVLFVAYMASRVYLIVEVVLVIPYLDPGVYKPLALSEYRPQFQRDHMYDRNTDSDIGEWWQSIRFRAIDLRMDEFLPGIWWRMRDILR